MRILLVEDDEKKAATIESLIRDALESNDIELVKTTTINDTLLRLGEGRFDLVVVDLVLPQMKGGKPVDATTQWCEQIEGNLLGRAASWIVMTSYSDVAHQARRSFALHNVAVVLYDESGVWKRNLLDKVRDSYEMRPLDFIIVCALKKERRAYEYAACTLGKVEPVLGLDCQSVLIGNLRGAILLQPTAGLISAAIVATKAIAAFRPRAVAMSGICGGIDSPLGSLVVPDISWDYQRGRFMNGKLLHDPLQVAIPPTVRRTLSQMISDELSIRLRKNLMHPEFAMAPVQLGAMVSGSQVAADQTVGENIKLQSRKVSAIDMEVAAVFSAAHDYFDGGGIYFAAKTVVDLANPSKDDQYHEYGSALSARFVVDALRELLVGTVAGD